MYSESVDQAGGIIRSSIKLLSRKKFAEWKHNTDTLSIQKGHMYLLNADMKVFSDNELENMLVVFDFNIDMDNYKLLKISYLKQKSERKLNSSAFRIILMAAQASLIELRHID